MAGVFEVEVDGVEHDHGLEHHGDPNPVGRDYRQRSERLVSEFIFIPGTYSGQHATLPVSSCYKS